MSFQPKFTNQQETRGEVHAFSGPEWLVGVGFRCWLAGYETGDITCWENGWNTFNRVLGPARAKRAVTELACWVRATRAAAARKIEYNALDSRRFCADECMAMSLIAASQDHRCPARPVRWLSRDRTRSIRSSTPRTPSQTRSTKRITASTKRSWPC